MRIETKTGLIGQMPAFVGQAELWITLKLIYEKVCQIQSVKNDINYIHLNPPTLMLEDMEKCFGGVLFILSDFSFNSASEQYCYAAYTEQQTS